ncbi:MAG: hypothetical protein D6822_02200 [Cyanobacteria bacterium J149]|nr:MAG: hypothetical protein D6822_02200 [Cyanobacteria bacterium J149]
MADEPMNADVNETPPTENQQEEPQNQENTEVKNPENDDFEVKYRKFVEEEDKKEPEIDEEEIDPKDREVIDKLVSSKLSRYEEMQLEAMNKMEVGDYIADHPEFKPYKEKALKILNHPKYRHMPVEYAMYIAAGDDLMKLGAQKEREAAQAAKETNLSAGAPARQKMSGKVDWLNMPSDEFNKRKAEILHKL